MDVYFDYVEVGSNKLELGVVMVEDFEVLLQEKKIVTKGIDTNFYHWSLEAMEFALELLTEDDFDEVCLKSQQKQLFDWLVKGNYKDGYSPYYEEIKTYLQGLVENGGTFTYEVVKGANNKAKKFLKKNATKVTAEPVKGDLTGMFASSHKNVVEFLKKKA